MPFADKCNIDPFILLHQNAALVSQYKSMKEELLKTEDIKKSVESEGMHKDEVIALILKKLNDLYTFLQQFTIFLESKTKDSDIIKNKTIQEIIDLSKFSTNQFLYQDIVKYCNNKDTNEFSKMDFSSILNSFYESSFQDIDAIISRLGLLQQKLSDTHGISASTNLYDTHLANDLNQYKSLYPLFITEINRLKEENRQLSVSIYLKEKILSKELCYDIVLKQLDVDKTIENNYKSKKELAENTNTLHAIETIENKNKSIDTIPVENVNTNETLKTVEQSDEGSQKLKKEKIIEEDCTTEKIQKERLISREREERIQSLEHSIEVLLQTNKDLEQQIIKKNEDYNSLYLMYTEEKKQLESEPILTLHMKNVEFENENKELRTQLFGLQADLETKIKDIQVQYTSELSRLTAENQRLTADNASLRAKSDIYKQKCWNRSILYKQVKDQGEIISKLQASIPTREQYSAMTPKDPMVEMLTNELSLMSEAFEKSEATMKSYQKQLDALEKMNDKNVLDTSRHNEYIMTLKSNLEKLQNEKNLLINENQKLQISIKQEQDNFKALFEKYMNFYNEYDQYVKKVSSEVKYIEEVEQKINELKLEYENLKKSTETKCQKIYSLFIDRKKLHLENEKLINDYKPESADDESIIPLLYNEIKNFKGSVTCEVCEENPKDTILTTCYHVFCRKCIEDRINRRERKCPHCLLPFGPTDVQKIRLFNDVSILENWKINKQETTNNSSSSYQYKRIKK